MRFLVQQPVQMGSENARLNTHVMHLKSLFPELAAIAKDRLPKVSSGSNYRHTAGGVRKYGHLVIANETRCLKMRFSKVG